jgi:inosine-uridine nucleoside N-ribohydrolase
MPTPRVVLDTDTYNEVDDQFALAHLLLSDVRLEAVYAAPFLNERSTSPGEGMEKSFEEIHRVYELVQPDPAPPVFRGSRQFLPAANQPVESEAASDLVERAMASNSEKLHVVAIAAATNVASAILLEPRVAEKIRVIWLGGHAPFLSDTREFNLAQDLHAARVLLDSPVPLVLLPCFPVCSHLRTSVPELEALLAPQSKLGAYLTRIVREHGPGVPAWSKVIWDIGASAWMVNPEWVQTIKVPSPVLRDDVTWELPTPAGRKEIDMAFLVQRDAIFADFFEKAGRLDK